MSRPILYLSDLLGWIDAFHARCGRWPKPRDGQIPGMLGLTWNAVDSALRKGQRGLPRLGSLAKLLHEYRGYRHQGMLPDYDTAQILAWADAHYQRTGEWPSHNSGPVAEAPGETWLAVDQALRNGRRGLTGSSSVAQLLAGQRGVRNHMNLPSLTAEQVLAWADAYHERRGRWPTCDHGPIAEAPGETWAALDWVFHAGSRGLSGYGSLAWFLHYHGRIRHLHARPPLAEADILAWADAHHSRAGHWPKHTSGPIPEAPGETWAMIHQVLYRGGRGFPGGSSLYCFLGDHRAALGYPARRRRRRRPANR